MTEDTTRRTTGAELLAGRPSWAKAAIVAELHENDSDIQTDYFNHKTTRVVVLAWSRHSRDLFPEMRKAAERFEPTANLGTGKGDFRVHVVLASDYISNGAAYWKGQRSPWHAEELGGEEYKAFDTREAAEAWVAQAQTLDEMHDSLNADSVARFEYRISEESIEHREKWSMGHGYYLKRGHTHDSAWSVCKHGLSWIESHATEAVEEASTTALEKPALSAASIEGTMSIGFNAEKHGIELRFSDKPSDDVRARLKANGWRWSGFSGCWYTRDTPEAREFAELFSAELRR